MFSRVSLLISSVLLLLPSISYADSSTQTDWSGGPFFSGPVMDWTDQFYGERCIEWGDFPGSTVLGLCEKHIVDIDDPFWQVYSMDMDGDGDNDILCNGTTTIAWWENTNGSGTAWIEHTIHEGDPPGCSQAIRIHPQVHPIIVSCQNVEITISIQIL